jgi:phosphoserine phosphatase
MITDGTNFASASASADLPLAVGPAISTSGFLQGVDSVFTATVIAAGSLSPGDISHAADCLQAAGCENLSSDWVDQGVAYDLNFTGDPLAARAALDGCLGRADVVVQKTADRRRRFLIADMDSTMITVECIDELADYAGIKAEIADVTERAMRGELDFEAALKSRVALLKGLAASAIDQCLAERVKIMPGAKALVQTVKAHGGAAVLVSGGFTAFADPVAKQIGFDRAIANTLGITAGVLNGTVGIPIVGADTKRVTLLATLAEKGWALSDSLAVGDGANDIPMIKAAGLGVAYHAKPKTEAAAAASIRFGDLSALLYAMGYQRADWITE